MDIDQTIVAIASPPGPSARGLVRLSGPGAWEVAGRVLDLDGGVIDERSRAPIRRPAAIPIGDGRRLDADAAFWPEGRSYTGQPMAELITIGSPPLLQRVLSQCLGAGARLAGPGEFTLRAFLGGKLDLTRAEAVLAVIDADSSPRLDAALRQLAGGLSGPIGRLRDRLLDMLAHLEAGLDFVEEEDVDPLGRAALAEELAGTSADLAAMADRLGRRERSSSTPRVVLVGPPNAGKSRLFNALVGADAALVSDRAGTTRDYLVGRCDCGPIEVELIDTAGLDDADDAIEAEAQHARAAQAEGADLLLDCGSGDAPHGVAPPGTIPRLLVWTKADLATPPPEAIATSAATGAGLDALRDAVAATLRARSSEDDPSRMTSARCREGLSRASGALGRASGAASGGLGDELIVVDLRDAVEELGRVIGARVDDAILDRIFRRFCIGK